MFLVSFQFQFLLYAALLQLFIMIVQIFLFNLKLINLKEAIYFSQCIIVISNINFVAW